jgi:hypothetical protein
MAPSAGLEVTAASASGLDVTVPRPAGTGSGSSSGPHSTVKAVRIPCA